MTIFDNQNNNQVDQKSVTNKYEVPEKAPTINNGSSDTIAPPLPFQSIKHNRKLMIAVLLIAVLLLCGGVIAFYKSGFWGYLSCNELKKSIQIEDSKINYECKTDIDCIRNDKGGLGCMNCINKNTSEEYLKKIGDIYATGVKKGCFPQLQCRQSTCQCMNNKCEGIETRIDTNPFSDWRTYETIAGFEFRHWSVNLDF